MKIGIYTSSVNHCIETILYWLSYRADYEVLLITPTHASGSEHSWCLKRLDQYKALNITIVSPESQAEETEMLYIKSERKFLLCDEKLRRWAQKSKQQGLLSHTRHGKSYKQLVAESAHAFPYIVHINSVVLQTRPTAVNLFFFAKNKCFYSPSVHPQFLIDKAYLELLFECDEFPLSRKYRFTFLGNTNPPERIPVLQTVKQTLNNISEPVYFEDHSTDSQTLLPDQVNILWIQYGDHGGKRGLKPLIYIDALYETDFCICPLGWGGNWTHRVIEALVCGAIPILEDEQEYNVELQDMKNCIVVKNNGWKTAIDRAYRLSPEAILEMRTNIKQLREQYLIPEVAAKRFRQSIGLN